jgi:hypothetical protein
VRRLWRMGTKAPLAVAGLIAVPAFFACLLASSLALDKPRMVRGEEFAGTSGTEAKVWLAALIGPAIVMAVGVAALALRRHGVHLPAVAGIVICLVLPGISNGWIASHSARFPLGVDFVKDSDPSNYLNRGEWEQTAQHTIASITHWTLGLCIGTIAIAALLELRRRRGREAAVVGASPAAVTGQPGASAGLELADSDLVRSGRPGRWRNR